MLNDKIEALDLFLHETEGSESNITPHFACFKVKFVVSLSRIFSNFNIVKSEKFFIQDKLYNVSIDDYIV